MKVSFTPKEYARLLELVHLGLHIAAPRDHDDEHGTPPRPAAGRYDELVAKLLELATPLGCADLVDVGADGRLLLSDKIADDDRLNKLVGDYNNDTFWHELVNRLADRDLATQQTQQSLSAGGGPPLDADARLRELEDSYWEHFEENDLANLVLLRGGKG
jgi:hypothetical protein